jgi:hypothetical protein
MNDFIPHIVLGLFSTNLPTIEVITSYWIVIFILNILPNRKRFNPFNLPRFAAKDTPTQIHNFIAFILGRLFGTLLVKFM